MASKQQKQIAKKKDRERESRKKVLARRAERRAPAQATRQLRRRIKRIAAIRKNLGSFDMYSDQTLLNMDTNSLSQLERNAQILRALEAEFEESQSQKSKLNEELESLGLHTLEQKMAHLNEQLVKQQREAGFASAAEERAMLEEAMGFGGSADCHRPTKEVAEVEILKAPTAETDESEEISE